MATSSSSVFPRKRNRCTLTKLSLFLFSLFCLFLLGRRILDPNFLRYSDFISLTPVPLSSPPRSTEPVEKYDDLTKPVLSVSDPFDNVDENSIDSSSESSDQSNEETTADISSKSHKITENPTSPVISSPDAESDGNLGEITFEPMPSNENTNTLVSSRPNLDGEKQVGNVIAGKWQNCDFHQGKWVKDEGYPLYKPGSCPYVDEAFDCQNNGRPDTEYLKWRWKPDECDLPSDVTQGLLFKKAALLSSLRKIGSHCSDSNILVVRVDEFNATDFLVRLAGKKLMLVGDSMNRNQFESLLCLLREGLPDKSKMYEVHGYKITKGRGFFVFKFQDYNCTVEFVRSHFLVREGVRVNAQGNSNPTLSIDRIDKTARRWQGADILVFNTGHWWAHGKTSRGKNYYKEGDVLYPHLDAVEAYRRAIKTWATWIKKHLAKEKLVFYRGYSSAHFRGGDWDSGGSCNGETEPVKSGVILDSYPQKMTIVEDVLKETQVSVVLLNVTRLTNYRKDGHPSVYGKNVTGVKKVSTRRQDCSHWCLPGVPDAWNELIYATLVARQT
ncbi:Protein trichome birefringence-like 5 [Orobanche minor]